MDAPITDIVFVCSLEKVPKGYSAIQKCPCGHSAQLWEKVLGGEPGARYLCYTKENQDDNKVIEDIYIPGPNQQYLKKGYKIITDTVEGVEPMRHKQLALKKVLRSNASTVIVDVIICRSKDDISKMYTKLMKVNGCRIAFRTANYVPPSDKSAEKDLSTAMEKLSTSENKIKASGKLLIPSDSGYTPSSSTLTSSTQATHRADLTSYSPSPPLMVRDEGEVKMKVVSTLESSAPPPPPSQPHPHPPPSSQETPSSQTSFAVKFEDNDHPSGPSTSHPVGMTPTPAPVPQQDTPTATPTYPPVPSYSSGPPLPYQMNPGSSQVPPQQYPGGYMGGAAFDSSQQSGLGGYYPSAPPPSKTNYDTSIGFSFGGGSGGGASNSSLPAPYNPYHHQQQQQPQQQPGYPGYGPPPPQGNSSWGAPNGGQGGGPSYGFNF